MTLIRPQKLSFGDTIGIIAPCLAQNPETIQNALDNIKKFGFKVKLSKNLFSNATGFSGTIEERADDFNSMIADNEVKMLLFEGGEVCNEILPYIDYEAVKNNPKIICSYSDSTTILNAVHYKTGLVTFNGFALSSFNEFTDYNKESFINRLMSNSLEYKKGGAWSKIRGGSCTGRLVGGYLVNFAVMQNGRYFGIDNNEKYILFIEDHEAFSSPAVVSKFYSHIEQAGLFDNVSGLIMGHYSDSYQPQITDILKRIADKYNIPAVKNDDFGHGRNNAILPLGVKAKLDADNLALVFYESGVV